jgi:hypothetical protein
LDGRARWSKADGEAALEAGVSHPEDGVVYAHDRSRTGIAVRRLVCVAVSTKLAGAARYDRNGALATALG